MVCIYCGEKTKIINSRSTNHGLNKWRRHKCTDCKAVFTTQESFLLSESLRVINKKGQIESFWRDKLYLSIYEAIGHLKQPQIASTHLTDTIVSKLILHKEAGALIKTENIINTTKQVIKNYDAAGSVRYMSYRLDMKLPRDIKQTLK